MYKSEADWHQFAISLSSLFPWGKRGGQKHSVKHMPTNNYLVSREKALAVGGFHPLFAYVGEDLDFSVRLREMSKIFFNPNFVVHHKLPLSYVAWLRKMAFYGRAQSMVVLNNRGGLSLSKFFPLFITLFFIYSLISTPIATQIVFLIAMFIPRLRFLTLSFLYYGFGEIVGAFIFLLNIKGSGLKALTEPPRQTVRRT
ncbi:MAG: hypothetical protein HRT44_04735 [Bdellovibrionales bacterium]|nr:hypothetical protein [Bdellovibrionales bacterium]